MRNRACLRFIREQYSSKVVSCHRSFLTAGAACALQSVCLSVSLSPSFHQSNHHTPSAKKVIIHLSRLHLRILELLRLTDPNRPATSAPAELSAFAGGRGEVGGGSGDVGEAEVSEELIGQLEERVAQAEVRTELPRVKYL